MEHGQRVRIENKKHKMDLVFVGRQISQQSDCFEDFHKKDFWCFFQNLERDQKW